jgi:hypothetical protein
MSKPKKWPEVYPHGTKEGDEEAKFFKALARHHKFQYRSIAALQQSTGLPRERIEEMIDKYTNRYDPPLIYPHPTNEDHWGYWERCQDQLKTDKRNISQKDQDGRVDKHLQGNSMVGGGTCGCDDDGCSNCP